MIDEYPTALQTEGDLEEVFGVPKESRRPTRSLPKFWTLRALLGDPSLLEPPTPLIQNLAYSGRTTLLAGQDKAGKSTLMTQAVAALTSGGEFLDHELEPSIVL